MGVSIVCAPTSNLRQEFISRPTAGREVLSNYWQPVRANGVCFEPIDPYQDISRGACSALRTRRRKPTPPQMLERIARPVSFPLHRREQHYVATQIVAKQRAVAFTLASAYSTGAKEANKRPRSALTRLHFPLPRKRLRSRLR